MNKNKTTCCRKREETLNKISIQKTPVVESISEGIRWTKSKKICQECKEFRADSLNMMDTEADKDAYIGKYFATVR